MTRDEIIQAIASKKSLSGADLRGANLRWANLSGADLRRADLRGASLRWANLREADLSGASLHGADLYRADLRGASLCGADLYEADLSGANLRGADLSGADLRGASLRWANLYRASLCKAGLSGANNANPLYLAQQSILPEGVLTVWKKLSDGIIAELQIPANALRVNAYGSRKCRFSKAIVISLSNGTQGYGRHDPSFLYKVGKTVVPDKFDPDPAIECSHGIHAFITRIEAEAY